MRILDVVLARLSESGVRDIADEATLAYVAMVATTADGGSWPGLPIEVTDRAAFIDALVTAVEVRTLNAAWCRPTATTQYPNPNTERHDR